MQKDKLSLFIAGAETSLVSAMQKIDSNANGIIFIVDEMNRLIGSVSDGDIRRQILKSGRLDANVRDFMNANPFFLNKDDDSDPYIMMKAKSIKAIPVLCDGMISDIYLSGDQAVSCDVSAGKLFDVDVVVMAGGKGTRLYPYTKILPKPLIPIGGIPILERILDAFSFVGIKNFFLTVNYRKNMIKSYFSELDKPYYVNYVEESKPLGTAGSIKLIEKKFSRPVFITNCDTLIRADYSKIYDYHVKAGNAITIVSAMKQDVIPYGVISAKEDGVVVKIDEKPKRSYLINTGMYVINPDMIQLIPDDTMFHMTHLTEAALSRGLKVGMYPVSEDSFLDMGEFTEMKRMEDKLKLKG